MKNSKFKKWLAIVLAAILTVTLGITVYAHDWPDDIDDWDEDDWNAWEDYWDDYWEEYEDNDGHGRSDWRYSDYGYRYDKPYYNYGYYEQSSSSTYYNPNNNITPSGYNSNTKGNGNGYNGAYNYGTYSYYNGVLNIYDAGTEGQAQILAKIIHLYAHGVSSQTQQACVGWCVMNAVDASGGGVDIGAVAPNFHYNASEATTDDFGRDLMPLARDVIFRWKAGKAGYGDNGRVLPLGYYYVTSTGSTVSFTNATGGAWNFSAKTPYGS